MLRLIVIQPDEGEIRMFHLRHHLMNDKEIWMRFAGIAPLFFRVKLCFNISRIHGPEFIQREFKLLEPFHNEGDDAVTDFIPATDGSITDAILA